ncbi:MAG: TRAP transporter small permease subunit [Gammaproteobacteria bacterium]|nr:MAG: TRAP transporter small permease subunit [Gammaproteobacteria bacterium]
MTFAQPCLRWADRLDNGIRFIGRSLSWVYALLVAVIILQVILRYGFGHGLVALEELEWHLYAIGVMFGVAYSQVLDSHVRVDLFHTRLRRRTQLWVDILGTVFLLMPFLIIVFLNSLDFVYDAWRIGETSDAPSGLPYRWAIKAVIPLSFGLLFIASVSRILRSAGELMTKGGAA